MKTKFMSVSMSLLIAGFTLCACTEGLGGVGDNPITPETPTTPDEPETPETPTEIKGILSEISVESEGNNGVLAFTYGDDGKVTKAAYKSVDPFTGDSYEGLSCTFTYETDKITVKAKRDDNVETKVYTLTDGVVTKYADDYGYDEFTYKDGKLLVSRPGRKMKSQVKWKLMNYLIFLGMKMLLQVTKDMN
jgi:hypothetical protein